jgi:hypothetical protein
LRRAITAQPGVLRSLGHSLQAGEERGQDHGRYLDRMNNSAAK